MLTVVISVLILLSNPNPQVDVLRGKLLDVVGLIGRPLSVIPRSLNIWRENRELRERMLKLTLENAALREAELENRRLRSLLNFKEHKPLHFIPAEVIGMGFPPRPGSVMLNVGERDGVAKNMPILSDQGLVGRIYVVGEITALGQLITDRDFRAAAKVQRSRVNGVLHWLEGKICSLEEVPKNGDVRVNDRIITSGYGGVFPAGLDIGTVVSVDRDQPGIFQRILVRLNEDPSQVEEMFIVTGDFNIKDINRKND